MLKKEKIWEIAQNFVSNKDDVMDAFPLMMKLKEKETYVLLENDLPDSFNEKIRSDK